MSKPRTLYVIKRGPRPAHHKATFHPVIVCSRKHTAQWEAGCTNDRAFVWSRSSARNTGEGFLLERWNGLDIDYGGVVHAQRLPDGTEAAFSHPQSKEEPWSLLDGAIWWSIDDLPEWLAELGVRHPEDSFTRRRIKQDSGLCLLPISKAEAIRNRRWEKEDG